MFLVLTTIILSIILIYFLYRWAKKALYMYRLKTEFNKLTAHGVDVRNYNVMYFNENKKNK